MKAAKPADLRLESAIGHLLRVGVSLAALLVLLGGLLYLRHPGVPAPDYTRFPSSPAQALSLRGTLAAVTHGSSTGILQLGLLVLIATPVVRVLFALVGFLIERDKLYTAVSALVLAILLYSLLSGLLHSA